MNHIGICHTPTNQVRLTNVAYVRLQKNGKRFEIACYRNKVLNWRNKIETDIDEVLQIATVFLNVSKGLLASSKDLLEVFGTTDQKSVCKEILDKGELQVSERERGALYESVYRDVASIVADKTVNSETGRPYTISMIQNAMKQIQYSVSVSKNSKSQALDVIRKLREIMPIVRANMLLRVVCIVLELESIRSELVALGAVIVADSTNTSETKVEDSHLLPHKSHPLQQQCSLDLRVDPESFRRVEEIVAEKTTGAGRVEVIQVRVANSLSTSTAVAASTQQAQVDGDGVAAVDDVKATPVSKNAGKAVKGKRPNNIEQQILSSAGLSGLQDSEDEEEAVGIVRKEKKKSKGKKVIAAPVPLPSLSDSEEEQSDGADSDNEALQMALAVSASLAAAEAADVKHKNDNQTTSANNKKGKKSKRLEKEELKEREQKASILRERAHQQQHVFTATETSASAATTLQPVTVTPGAASGSVQSCNTCGGAFHDVKDYRTHFKSEWHRYNLSRKMKGLSLVGSEEAFLSLSLEELEL